MCWTMRSVTAPKEFMLKKIIDDYEAHKAKGAAAMERLNEIGVSVAES